MTKNMMKIGVILVILSLFLAGCGSDEDGVQIDDSVALDDSAARSVSVDIGANTAQALPPTAIPYHLMQLSVPDAAVDELTTAVGNDPVITYKKSGGVMGGTREWNVYADGRIEQNGEIVQTVHPALVANLLIAADDARFYALEKEYMDVDPCCDLYTYVLTITDGQQSHTVTKLEGAPYAPAYGAMETAVEHLLHQTEIPVEEKYVTVADGMMEAFITAVGTDPVITYKKSGGVTGMTQEWNVYADGRITQNGEEIGAVAPVLIVNLAIAAEDAGFYVTEEAYLDTDPCCDLISYELTVTNGSKTHTIETIDNAPRPFAVDVVMTAVEGLIRTLNK